MATVCASSLGGGQLLPAVAGICSLAWLPPARARLERCRERALEPGPHPAGPRHRAWPPGARHRSPALTRPALGSVAVVQAKPSSPASLPRPSSAWGPTSSPRAGNADTPGLPGTSPGLSTWPAQAAGGDLGALALGWAGQGWVLEKQKEPHPDTPPPTALLGFMPHPSDPPAHSFLLVFETCLRWLCFSWGQNLRGKACSNEPPLPSWKGRVPGDRPSPGLWPQPAC